MQFALRIICNRRITETVKERVGNSEPRQTLQSAGVNYLFSVDQIFALTDRRGRRSLQREIKLPYEKSAFPRAFFLRHHLDTVAVLAV